jgi:hypothetical protein
LAARERARREGQTLGDVISVLARQALNAPPLISGAVREPKPTYGFRPFPSRGGVVTNALIDKLRDDDIY